MGLVHSFIHQEIATQEVGPMGKLTVMEFIKIQTDQFIKDKLKMIFKKVKELKNLVMDQNMMDFTKQERSTVMVIMYGETVVNITEIGQTIILKE